MPSALVQFRARTREPHSKVISGVSAPSRNAQSCTRCMMHARTCVECEGAAMLYPRANITEFSINQEPLVIPRSEYGIGIFVIFEGQF